MGDQQSGKKRGHVTMGHQRPSEASEALRGRQRPSEAIRGHQRPSEAIRGQQRPAEAT